MTVQEILISWLIEHNFDGLWNEDCGCQMSDLMPCENMFSDCQPGYKIDCPGGEDCAAGGDCDFHIHATKIT
ncbi:hypothetical protein LCGC14_1113910 [marine sediment metagenome]|uniref:Uncharacterized protein n=1 Tax=marine sediment metagenome TaxID=412755 RepID=A0A0F9QC23_9ZZZZ